MHSTERLSTGVPGLDPLLGGGLIPGTLTVVWGAAASARRSSGCSSLPAEQEGGAGDLFDMNARIDRKAMPTMPSGCSIGDSSSGRRPTRPRAGRLFRSADTLPATTCTSSSGSGRRVTQRDLGFDAWHDWQAELAAKLEATIAFFYGNFIRGAPAAR